MKFLYLTPLLILAGCATVSAPTSIDLCKKTVRDYGHLRDEGPAERYADLFTQDGEFHLGPNVTKGRDALIARHTQSNAETIWRHNMTDIRISGPKEGLIGVTRFHIFAGPRREKTSAPSREIIGDYLDEFVVETGTCKIKSRKIEIVFDSLN